VSGTNPYAQWLQARREAWAQLSQSVQGTRRDRSLEEARDVLDGYRSVSRDVSLARQHARGTTVHAAAEALYAQTHRAIHNKPKRPLAELWQLYSRAVPAAVRALRGEISLAVGLFVLAIVLGLMMTTVWRDTAQIFLSEDMLLMVQNQTLWTDDLLNVMPSSLLSYQLMTNNISVALTAFALGLLYGIGTLYIITLNGLMLGAAFGYTAHYQMSLPLFKFIVAHGLVELSVIVLAGAAGMALGKALARPGTLGRIHSLRIAARHAGALAAVSVPFLIGSGVIEGYISPNNQFGLASRIFIGVLWFVILLAVLDGRCWNLMRRPAGSNAVVQP